MLNSYSVLSKQTQIWSHTSPQTGSLIMRCRIFFFQTVLLLMPELSWGYKTKGDKTSVCLEREMRWGQPSPTHLESSCWCSTINFPSFLKIQPCATLTSVVLLASSLLLLFPWTKLYILETSSNLCLLQLHRWFVMSTCTYTLLKIRCMKYTSFIYLRWWFPACL